MSLSLHVWNPPYKPYELDDHQIHDHRCDQWSAVLVGSIETDLYIRESGGARFDEYGYTPSWTAVGSKKNLYKPLGGCPLSIEGTRRCHAGERYYIEASTIHRVSISEKNLTVTFVVRGPVRRAATSVFSANRKYPSVLSMDTLSVPHVQRTLELVIRSLPT